MRHGRHRNPYNNPYKTKEECERLTGMVRGCKTVVDLKALFPRFWDGARWATSGLDPQQCKEEWIQDGMWHQLEDMKQAPCDPIEGVLAHRCNLCGNMTGARHSWGMAGDACVCPPCVEELLTLRYPDIGWNGITKAGDKATDLIVEREHRIPTRQEMASFQPLSPYENWWLAQRHDKQEWRASLLGAVAATDLRGLIVPKFRSPESDALESPVFPVYGKHLRCVTIESVDFAVRLANAQRQAATLEWQAGKLLAQARRIKRGGLG